MPKRLIVRGPGMRGPAGRDGSNVVPTDEALAGLIADAGSDTRAALNVLIGGGGGAPRVPLFLFIGESNAGGLALNSALASAQLAPRSAVKIWDNANNDGFDTLDIGTNNLLGHDGITGVTDPLGGGNYDATRHGWENGLATSAEGGDWGSHVYLVKAGQGASRLDQWDDGDAYWTTFITRITGAIDAIRDAGYEPDVYVLASIGINDADFGTAAATYGTGLASWLGRIRTAVGTLIGSPGIPVAFAQLPAEFSDYNAQIAAVDAADPLLLVVSTAGVPLDAEGWHWTSAGMDAIAADMLAVLQTQVAPTATYAINVVSARLAALLARVVELEAGGGGDPGGGGGTDILASAADTFARADSATLDTTETGSLTWTMLNGSMGVTSNTAKASAVPGDGALAQLDATNLAGTVLDFEAKIANQHAGSVLLAFSVTDLNNLYAVGTAATPPQLFKRVAGTYTDITPAGFAGAAAYANGDVWRIRVDVDTQTYTFTRNGVALATVTDTSLAATKKVGLFTVSLNTQYDDVLIETRA